MSERMYLCIDLKSFFASVECADRGLDPFKDRLVVADASRGRGAICLAVTPALRELGIKSRCRLFEIPENIEYTAVLPRMKRYMEVSAEIYSVYLRYVSEEDIHVYSIDECFIDVTDYLKLYGKTAAEMAKMLMQAVMKQTKICATAGVGTNMFLAKVALDVTAKHSPDFIGILDEESFRKTMWEHTPVTDIWGIGRATARRLERMGAYCLYDITRIDEKRLYKEFGINAQYLIDHAYGREPCTIADIRSYTAKSSSISHGQILFEDYSYENALIVMKEMTDKLVLELVEKNKVTDQVSLGIRYSDDSEPPTGASRKLVSYTDSYRKICEQLCRCFEETTRRDTPIRAINIGFGNLADEVNAVTDLFTDPVAEERERRMQEAVLAIKNKYGKNALLRGMSFQEKATAQQRNKLIGGHNGE